ncbi:SgcJ/EcaC family oxidoreductase [Nocardiopsis sp. EMB25]|uniref:SgcJ/EcaC family oxidoreductase n=1 Tax=Nocardiopsis sp. EMB25 TaxID=2835867 RepID=UPI002283F583|nr:SgcJ/EcaC family oxidoreductase [Nocardiopsis sp. EMB25]MCY9782692.1 SgcJ/EcaC family oxidoreductase [Nocardiopsis sp. EMB25]
MATTDSMIIPGLSAEDSAHVAGLPGRIIAAWADQDAKAFSEVFAEECTMVLPGVLCSGREEVHGFMAQAFAGPFKGTRVTGAPVRARALGADAAVLVTQGGVMAPGEEEVSDARAVRATWVAVRTGDGWRLAAYQNGPRDAA